MTFTINALNNLLATTALSGVLQAAQFPALTGDVTTSPTSLATTIASNAVSSAKFRQSAANTLVGNPTGSAANVQDITLGAGLSFSGTTLVASGTAYYTYSAVSGTTQAMAANGGYVPTNSSPTTFTLPPTAAVNDKIKVVGYGSGGWSIAQNSGQTIHSGSGNTTPGTGGSISGQNRYDCIELLCTVANTDFVVVSSQGNLTGV